MTQTASHKKNVQTRNGIDTFRRAFPSSRCLWQSTIKGVGNIEAFWLGKTMVIVQEYDDGNGWNAFTPTTDEGRIDLTIKAIGERCGVDPLREDEPVASQEGR